MEARKKSPKPRLPKFTVHQFNAMFPDEESCLDFILDSLYPDAGTIFAKSSTPLKSWFYGLYIMSSTRCGISAKQLERELGVTYKTAWRMFKQIRSLLEEDIRDLAGTVETD